MADEHKVHVVCWPQERARLEHHLSSEEDIPVSISFETTPAHVVLSAQRENPLAVNMNMSLRAPETLSVCISLCEPICAESNYTIRISIFDRPMITINIRGKTRLFGNREEL